MIKKCKLCGKSISSDFTYCSDICHRLYSQISGGVNNTRKYYKLYFKEEWVPVILHDTLVWQPRTLAEQLGNEILEIPQAVWDELL